MAGYVDKIAQQLGISAPAAERFMDAARAHTEHSLPYRQIYEHLTTGHWPADLIQQMAATAGIPLNPLNMAVLGTAHILDIPTNEAEEFIRHIDDHFPERVDAADIWQAVQAVDPAHLTVTAIIAEVEVCLIARELDISPEEARDSLPIISELIGAPLTNREILTILRAAGEPLTIDTLLERLSEQYGALTALAGELGDTPVAARQFADDVRGTYSWATDDDILLAMRRTPDADRTIQAIYACLETLFIGRALAIDPEQATTLPEVLASQTGYPLTRPALMAYLEETAEAEAPRTVEGLATICAVAATKHLSLRAATSFVSHVRQSVPFPITDAEFRQALAATRAPQGVSGVALTLQLNREARDLGIEPDALLDEIARTTHLDVSREELLQAARALGPATPPSRIITAIKDKYATPLFIAAKLAIEPAAVNETVSRLARQCRWPLTDDDVAHALRHITDVRASDQLLAELKVQRIADLLAMTAGEVRAWPATPHGAAHSTADPDVILDALSTLAPTERSQETVVALMRLANTLNLSFADVRTLREQAEKELGSPLSLTRLWRTVSELGEQNRNADAIIDRLKLERYVGRPEGSAAQLSRAIEFLSQDRAHAVRFWSLVDGFHRQGNLSAGDLAYIQQLATWLPLGLNAPLASDQAWLTRRGAQLVLAREDATRKGIFRRVRILGSNNQADAETMRLREMGRRSWARIRSAERRYAVPSRGRAEILASDTLRTRLSLHSLRFFQEGVSAPGVLVQFQFTDPAAVGVIRIDRNGNIEGFHQHVDSPWFQAVIEATALSFYRDLVIAVQVDLSSPPRRAAARTPSARTPSATARPHSPQSPRSIPSRRPNERPPKREHSLADWYRSQEIARHLVRGHTRYIGPNFYARWEKHEQARLAGVKLQRGETWVIEHERGDPQYDMPIELDGEDLIRHTLFSPPQNAVMELDALLR